MSRKKKSFFIGKSKFDHANQSTKKSYIIISNAISHNKENGKSTLISYIHIVRTRIGEDETGWVQVGSILFQDPKPNYNKDLDWV